MINLGTKALLLSIMLISLNGCSNMSKKDKGTLLGAGVGAAAGYATTGNGWGTAAGAVGGGYVGRQLSR